MTVYVDNFRVLATVGRLTAFWSHLTADTPGELNDFAESIGLKTTWFQAKCKWPKCPTINGICRHYHYDVTDFMRLVAIKHGALTISLAEFGLIVSKRCAQYADPT